MTNIAKFKTQSSEHRVVEENKGFSILPVSEDDVALKQFQPIALAALKYCGPDFGVKPHKVGSMIDMVFFYPLQT